MAIDAPWQYTNNRSLSFPALASGTYTFSLSAKGENSAWSKPVSIQFEIQEVFWKSNWFVSLIGAVFVGIVWLITQLYFSKIQRARNIKHRLTASELKAIRSRINPHFMFNALNSIQLFIKDNKSEEAVSYLNKFARLMRMILAHAERSTISIKEEVDALEHYLVLEKLRARENFDYEISISPDVDIYNYDIPAMVLQPFVENAIWHGLAPIKNNGLLQVKFEAFQEEIRVEVIDNGIGRAKSQAIKPSHRSSKGIKLTEDRIAALNLGKANKKRLNIEDLFPLKVERTGTKVTLTIPI